MADANLKPRRARSGFTTHLSIVLEEAPAANSKHGTDPAFPWMQVTDVFLKELGFLPGQHVLFSINPGYGQITISLDRDYAIGGQPMTESQIEAVHRRRNRPS